MSFRRLHKNSCIFIKTRGILSIDFHLVKWYRLSSDIVRKDYRKKEIFMSRAFSHTIKQVLLIGAILLALLVILCRVKK